MHEAAYQTAVNKLNCIALSAFGLLVSSSACNFLIGSCDCLALPVGLHFALHCIHLDTTCVELTTGSKNCRECSQCVLQY